MNWYENAIFYSIYPLGAVNAKYENDYVQQTEGMERLGDWVGHIAGLGCNAVYLAPIFESRTHGYDTTDYCKIDSRLGTNQQFAALVERFHKAGIRVVVDGVFNHTGRDFFAFQDLGKNRERSDYRFWYRGVDFAGNTPLNDGFSYEAWRGHYELPRLNPHNPAVCEYLFDSVRQWISEFDIDGIRLDCADCLDFGFMRELRRVCTGVKEDFWLMGEIIHGDYNRWVNAEILHSVTNYECSKGLYSSHNDGNLHEIAYSLSRQFGAGGIYRNHKLYNFTDNHDLNRLADTVDRPEYMATVYTILFTMPGMPSVYYGSEWGIAGKTDRVTDWALRPQIDIRTAKKDHPELVGHIQALAAVRKDSAALRQGDYSQVSVASRQLAFRRTAGDEEVLVLINIAEQPATLPVSIAGSALVELLGGNERIPVSNGRADVPVPAFGSRILRVEKQGASDKAVPMKVPRAQPVVNPQPVQAAAPQPAPVKQAPPPPAAPQQPAPVQRQPDGGVQVAWFDSLPAVREAGHPTYEHERRDAFESGRCKVALYELPPGKSAYPYHYHSAREEVYYLLSGQGLLRTPDGDRPVKAGDLLYFPAGARGAHRLINNHHEPLRYIDFDALAPGDAAVYPDSQKVQVDGTVYRLGQTADYYQGE